MEIYQDNEDILCFVNYFCFFYNYVSKRIRFVGCIVEQLGFNRVIVRLVRK